MQELKEMLTYQRCFLTGDDDAFMARFIDPVPGMCKDEFGNRYLRLGTQPTTLFCAHTDTMHLSDGRQRVCEDPEARVFYKDDGQPLGADDTTGCWILLNLIRAGVPGLYLFHRFEEAGSKGSYWIAKHRPECLEGIQRAIAFDSSGTTDIITHQCRGRSCSSAFAEALAERLGLGLAPSAADDSSDTASYMHRVAECTNLSVGYTHEHTAAEYQDYGFLEALLPALISLDWESLPTERRPAPHPYPDISIVENLMGINIPAMLAMFERGQYPPTDELTRIMGERWCSGLTGLQPDALDWKGRRVRDRWVARDSAAG